MKDFVSKVVIPVKTGIQINIVRHDFWIPTCVGMTKRPKTALMIQAPCQGKGDKGKRGGFAPSLERLPEDTQVSV